MSSAGTALSAQNPNLPAPRITRIGNQTGAVTSDPPGTPSGPTADQGHDPIGCAEAIDLFGAYLADEMTGWERRVFVEHLRGCAGCHDKLLILQTHLHLVAEEERHAAE
jgi:hypothetical protein